MSMVDFNGKEISWVLFGKYRIVNVFKVDEIDELIYSDNSYLGENAKKVLKRYVEVFNKRDACGWSRNYNGVVELEDKETAELVVGIVFDIEIVNINGDLGELGLSDKERDNIIRLIEIWENS